MRSTVLKIAIGLFILLVVGYGYYAYNNMEKHTVKKRVPQPYKVQNNPYLAAEYFLKDQQHKVTIKKNLSIFNSLATDNQTVLLLGTRKRQTTHQNNQIFDWVNRGGYLIVEAYSPWDTKQKKSADPFLDQLGIQLSKQKLDNSKKDKLLTKLFIEDNTPPAIFDFNPEFHIEDTQSKAYVWANSLNNTTHMLQLQYGEGLITIISDSKIWTNNQIDKHDHAWLLEYLTARNDVTLIYSAVTDKDEQQHPSLLTALLENFSYSLFALVLLLAAYLWRKGTRQGPLEPAISRDRRKLPEYLNASANFLLKRVGQQELISVLQQEINYRAKQRYSGFENLSVENQWKILSRLCNQPTRSIATLMRPGGAEQKKLSNLDFTQTVIALQAIRNSL